ncbi:hypothetical protein D9M68_913140 [compost metagenome]
MLGTQHPLLGLVGTGDLLLEQQQVVLGSLGALVGVLLAQLGQRLVAHGFGFLESVVVASIAIEHQDRSESADHQNGPECAQPTKHGHGVPSDACISGPCA